MHSFFNDWVRFSPIIFSLRKWFILGVAYTVMSVLCISSDVVDYLMLAVYPSKQ
jgi:predicted phosphatase